MNVSVRNLQIGISHLKLLALHLRDKFIANSYKRSVIFMLPAPTSMAVSKIFWHGVITPRSITLKYGKYTFNDKEAVHWICFHNCN